MKSKEYTYLANVYDQLMMDVDYGHWADFVEKLVLEQGDRPHNILELGCGTGNLTYELLRRGYEVVGIDISKEMLSIAREKTQEFGMNIILLQQDLTTLDFEVYEIDCIVAANDTFNYITDKNQLKNLLEYLYPRLKKGGQLVFDISSHHKLSQVLGNNVLGESLEEMAYLWENEFDEDNQLLTMEINLFTKKNALYQREIETHLQRAYLEEEILELLEKIGYQNIKQYYDFDINNKNEEAQRIFFSCVR